MNLPPPTLRKTPHHPQAEEDTENDESIGENELMGREDELEEEPIKEGNPREEPSVEYELKEDPGEDTEEEPLEEDDPKEDPMKEEPRGESFRRR